MTTPHAPPSAPMSAMPSIGGVDVTVSATARIFSQGDPADAVFYVRSGLVRFTVVSSTGKESVLGTASTGQILGGSCLAGARVRVTSATAVTECELLRIKKNVMMRALRQNRQWAELFIEKMLARDIRSEEDLVDQLLNSSDRRLARALLLLAGAGY